MISIISLFNPFRSVERWFWQVALWIIDKRYPRLQEAEVEDFTIDCGDDVCAVKQWMIKQITKLE